MELDDKTKEAVKFLGEAINAAVERSHGVKLAVENLHDIGFEPILTLKLEIGLQEIEVSADEENDSFDENYELTPEDVRTLLSIRLDARDRHLSPTPRRENFRSRSSFFRCLPCRS